MAVEHSEIVRDSADYAEILAEVFVETVQRYTADAMHCDYCGEEITRSLMECLQYVYLHGASPVREIACGLQVSVSAGSQLVDRLVKKGLVTRSENQADRRLTHVELTDSGRQIVEKMRESRSKWFESIMKNMPEEMRLAFLEGLEGFLKVSLADTENIDRACVKCGMEHVSFCVINKLKSKRADIRPAQ
ncbi:MAG: MarR family transcriptional regulator [Armatimonadota bacterium]|nr:MarR family transcriptional regulator [bacterium]